MEVEFAGLGASVPKVGRAAPFRTSWHGVHSRLLANPGRECGSPLEVAVARAGTASSSWRCTAATHRRLTCARSTKHAVLTLPRTIIILPEMQTEPRANLRGAVEACLSSSCWCGASLAIIRRHLLGQPPLEAPDLLHKTRQMTEVGVHLLEFGQGARRSSPIGHPLA